MTAGRIEKMLAARKNSQTPFAHSVAGRTRRHARRCRVQAGEDHRISIGAAFAR
jgi:hypothetical protein